MTAREAAKDLIRHYVLRGDTVKQLADGMLGAYNDRYSACIGGYIWNGTGTEDEKSVRLKRYQIGVERIGDREVMEVFSLRVIYNEILDEREGVQISLNV